MKVCCVFNTGEDLRSYENEIFLKKEVFGRFGSSANTIYDIEIGQSFIVMGIIVFETYQAYLIDDNGFVGVYPCQLFEIIDDKISSEWFFRIIEKDEGIYPFVQSLFGYKELCEDKNSYENLIVEKNPEAYKIYFERKREECSQT